MEKMKKKEAPELRLVVTDEELAKRIRKAAIDTGHTYIEFGTHLLRVGLEQLEKQGMIQKES